ncbi:MAG TPA: ribosome biogenesis GTPase Der, partial [Pseudomonadota bacterium]|nr:ribosome biogenesis GTPase Der [Pseudomonadota bacterium]
EPAVIRIALVGRPNAGKSSLVNALCGEERMIVDSTPGTTRDPVDTLIEHKGQRYLLIDTAGIRRRARVYEPMEKVAVAMAEKAVNRADIAILVIDAQAGIGEQDAKIAGLVADAGKVLIIAFNKRDLITAKDEKLLTENRDRQLQFVPWALQLSCSAAEKKNVLRLLTESQRCYASYARRVATGELNRFFSGIVQKHPPPLHSGKPIRLYYITQAQTRPPTFVISVNQPDGMHFSYQRYLQNQLRDTFGFVGTPVRLYARAKTRPT